MKYNNPILKGFYPDPSICRVGEDFFIVNSTLEFFPGVPVFYSKDLLNWKQVGHCISRSSQLKFEKGRQSNTGIFAPSIRYHEGIYYMITTNVTFDANEDNGNFYVWTKDPYGEWSDPLFLNTPGIDPSLYFDDNGKNYYVGTCDGAIYIHEIDLEKGKVCGDGLVIWGGTGGSFPEGPHIYKKNGWYYLLISEGGTERSHMITMARSKEITGPYESCPSNPVLTNRSLGLSIEAVGHADMVQDQNGNWWAVCLGTRTFAYPPKHNLGRETMLVPVDWSGDWPVFGKNGRVEEEMMTSCLPIVVEKIERPEDYYEDTFMDTKLDMTWNFIYNPDDSLWSVGDGSLKLYGNEHALSEADTVAWLG